MHFIRRERAINLSERTCIVPDAVMEVISHESRSRDQITKLRDYEAAGVGEYWLIDPIEDRVFFFRLRDGKFVEVSPDSQFYESEVAPGFSFEFDQSPRFVSGAELGEDAERLRISATNGV